MVRHPVVRLRFRRSSFRIVRTSPARREVKYADLLRDLLASRLPEGVALQGQTLFLGAHPGVSDLHADSSRVRHTRCFFSDLFQSVSQTRQGSHASRHKSREKCVIFHKKCDWVYEISNTYPPCLDHSKCDWYHSFCDLVAFYHI